MPNLRSNRKIFEGSESLLAGVLLFLVLLWPPVAIVRGVEINLSLTAVALAFQIGLIVFGYYARLRLKLDRVAKLAIAIGFFVCITNSVSNLISLRFPVASLWLDPVLMRVDGHIGYSWVGFVTWLAENPMAGNALAWIYQTSIAQIIFVMIVLAMSHRHLALDRMMLAGAGSLLVTVAIWMAAPSFGPAFTETLPRWVGDSISLVVDERYAAEMRRLVSEGSESVPPLHPLGLVAFPSYHTVMALLVVVYAWRTVFFWPIAAVNMVMLPAILGQGAHYVLDVFGGILVFTLSALAARRYCRADVPVAALPV